ncbi:Coiled-coil domain-containing protein 25 [Coccomyxa sp. Obi]|nr:Coiled-coil domain-containing protein 25 [Coccomyxa sp. Obi]
MVFYFQPRGFDAAKKDFLIYMGKDKFENEDLIRYSIPLDVWFHVDDLSSAHVYLRLPPGGTFEDIPAETLEDCCQLVKANSIQGNKLDNVGIVWTPVSNLKKTASMEVGQVGFKDQKLIRKTKVDTRVNAIVNRLNATKREEYPDLAAEREAYDKEVRLVRKAEIQAQKRSEKAAKEAAARELDMRSYKHVMTEENMMSTKEVSQKYSSFQDYEEDFM